MAGLRYPYIEGFYTGLAQLSIYSFPFLSGSLEQAGLPIYIIILILMNLFYYLIYCFFVRKKRL